MYNIKDPIVGLRQRMINGSQYMVLGSGFYNLRNNLVCNVLVSSTGKEIEYSFERILDDAKRCKNSAG